MVCGIDSWVGFASPKGEMTMKKAYVLLDLVALLTLTLSSCVPPAGWLHESRLRKFAKEDKMTEQMLEEF